MTRRPSVARALAQLERHGSGTPNDVVPPWNPAALGISMAELARGAEAGLRLITEAMRAARNGSVERQAQIR